MTLSADSPLAGLLERAPWQLRAACQGFDVNVWFPAQNAGADAYGPAQRVCDRCPVAIDCATYGWREPDGCWGGLTPVERRRARRQQLSPARAVVAARASRRRLAG